MHWIRLTLCLGAALGVAAGAATAAAMSHKDGHGQAQMGVEQKKAGKMHHGKMDHRKKVWIEVESNHDFDQTLNKLKRAIKSKGIHIFAEIDHAKGAKKIGAELEPTTLVIFGNPKVGTPLMQCRRSVAIDLPLKILVWQEGEHVKVGAHRAIMLKHRHRIGSERCDAVIAKVGKVLHGLIAAATGT